MSTGDIKYLIPADGDELWGLTVTGVGSQVITADEVYPPQNHPQGYFFDVEEGRVLDEFQLLYITDGEGMFTYGEPRVSQRIEEGKMFFLFPGVWHTYRPFENSGWKEYWIGFKGEMIDRLVASGSSDLFAGFRHRAQRTNHRPLSEGPRHCQRGQDRRTTGPFGDRDAPARTDVLPPEKQCPAR